MRVFRLSLLGHEAFKSVSTIFEFFITKYLIIDPNAGYVQATVLGIFDFTYTYVTIIDGYRNKERDKKNIKRGKPSPNKVGW